MSFYNSFSILGSWKKVKLFYQECTLKLKKKLEINLIVEEQL